ncbi:GDSL-type esterase/lipase family protein [bacterium]
MKIITRFTGILIMIMLTGCTNHQQKLFKAVEKKTHEAVTPKRIHFPEVQEWYWDRHDAVNERLKQGNVDILFVGNSITNGWDSAGRKYWDQYFAPLNAVNMGFGWDWTQHLLWRLDHSEFNNISPKLAVILIGTNNSNGSDNTAEEIADGMIATCGRLHRHFPKMKILLLAILPRQSEPCAQRTKVAEASLLASKIADGKLIHYLDIAEHFLQEDDKLKQTLMPDFLHPNEEGYRVLAEAIAPKINDLI